MTKVRFAPSPTGFLHVGNARTALINQLLAQGEGGTFVLRIDDTDTQRSKAEYEDAIHEDLAWLTFTVDEVFKQSDRFAQYDQAVETLKASGRLYPCYETEEELDRKRKLQRAQGKPPVYDRAALALSQSERAALESEGRKPHWRFKLSQDPVAWNDLVRGPVTIDTASLSDPILVRADGSYLYTLPSCVDDLQMGITHVVRGEDHTTNSGAQIEIFEALGGDAPAFAHTSLLVGGDGEKISKRDLEGGLSLRKLREAGYEAIAVLSHLAKIGTSDALELGADMSSLANAFSFTKLGRSPARFDQGDLARLNAQALHGADYASVQSRLEALGADGGAEFWAVVRENLETLSDARVWWTVVFGDIDPVVNAGDEAVVAAAIDAVPEGPLDDASWGAMTAAVKSATGAKGKGLFMPLRLALTGQSRGPDMGRLFPLIGAERAKSRFAAGVAAHGAPGP